jgi:mono/diheme cytochrome c family protein
LTCCTEKSSRQALCEFAPASSGRAETLKLAERFENDAAFRRSCLEQSLVNEKNDYAKIRLAHYSQNDWGSLPVAAFKTRPIVPADLGKPIPAPDATWSAVPSGTFPANEEGIRQRGEQMFTRFAAQLETSMIPILRDHDGPARYGLWQTSTSVGGMVWVALPGGVFPGLTCSSCHSSVDSHGNLRHGVPNHQFDLGRAKDDYVHMQTLYSTWGPGRVDVAADGEDNPVVIGDVRAVRFQQYLHRTANIKNSLAALALRLETGLILAHQKAVRLTPQDAFALAYYVWTLGEGLYTDAPMRHPGRRVFERHCASCHEGPAHTGKPVSPEIIESPVASMRNAARGTGKMRPPSLLGVSDRKRLLFGGEADGIDGLLDPNRSKGGHYVGKRLDDAERRAIKGYLESL